jgi:hypothetical protein
MKHYSPTGRRNRGRTLKRLLDTWDRNGSTSGLTHERHMMMMMIISSSSWVKESSLKNVILNSYSADFLNSNKWLRKVGSLNQTGNQPSTMGLFMISKTSLANAYRDYLQFHFSSSLTYYVATEHWPFSEYAINLQISGSFVINIQTYYPHHSTDNSHHCQ